MEAQSPHGAHLSNQSEPVSVDELEHILRDWNIEDGDQVLSVSSSSRTGFRDVVWEDPEECNIDLNSWTQELVGQIRHCQNDTAAADVIKNFLKAFETQATNGVVQHRRRLANANRVLVKTLQRVHRQHKAGELTLSHSQLQLEQMRTRAEVAESRGKVLELHLQRAMCSQENTLS